MRTEMLMSNLAFVHCTPPTRAYEDIPITLLWPGHYCGSNLTCQIVSSVAV